MRAFAIPIFIALLGMLSSSASADEQPDNRLSEEERRQGFQLLFDGEDLDGWKAQTPERFRVEEGRIIADGRRGRSMLYYVGDDGEASFQDFDLRLQVLTHERGNSGVYFRTKWQDAGYPDDFGYEAQIANAHKNPHKTGSLYRIKSIPQSPAKDGRWFDYRIVADGRTITVEVDGQVVTQYVEPADKSERKPAGGRIALQCHDPAIVEFRSIRIKPLQQPSP